MHVLPRVRELEERFADSLTVIGVHAGKFITERVTERIAEACDRLGVVHAVVNDRQFRVWRDYAVEAWPTVVAIDQEGYIAFIAPGETPVEVLSAAVREIVARAEARGTLVRGPDPTAPTVARHEGTLRFPTRAILEGGRLWVSDTGHGRVLECAWDGAEKTATVVGEHAGFAEPRGLAALDGHVYVADRAAHSVWRLGGGDRLRVAGTGGIGSGAIAPGPAERTDLRSPWGLATFDGRLAIAMAGSHQIWTLDLGTGALSLLAGSGAEEILDAAPTKAALAQPTGLAPLPDGGLAFADCETSAVRTLTAGTVRTIVGTGLFEFGDRDGAGDAALLQHCEDVAAHGAVLAVVDTYNDRLKAVDPVTRACAPWRGQAGERGSLREPGGVFSDGSTLLAADTGHHRVVVVEQDGSLTEVRFT
jgi:hypothetical protein